MMMTPNSRRRALCAACLLLLHAAVHVGGYLRGHVTSGEAEGDQQAQQAHSSSGEPELKEADKHAQASSWLEGAAAVVGDMARRLLDPHEHTPSKAPQEEYAYVAAAEQEQQETRPQGHQQYVVEKAGEMQSEEGLESAGTESGSSWAGDGAGDAERDQDSDAGAAENEVADAGTRLAEDMQQLEKDFFSLIPPQQGDLDEELPAQAEAQEQTEKSADDEGAEDEGYSWLETGPSDAGAAADSGDNAVASAEAAGDEQRSFNSSAAGSDASQEQSLFERLPTREGKRKWKKKSWVAKLKDDHRLEDVLANLTHFVEVHVDNQKCDGIDMKGKQCTKDNVKTRYTRRMLKYGRLSTDGKGCTPMAQIENYLRRHKGDNWRTLARKLCKPPLRCRRSPCDAAGFVCTKDDSKEFSKKKNISNPQVKYSELVSAQSSEFDRVCLKELLSLQRKSAVARCKKYEDEDKKEGAAEMKSICEQDELPEEYQRYVHNKIKAEDRLINSNRLVCGRKLMTETI